jgi:flagellar basal-body rod protein FlgF
MNYGLYVSAAGALGSMYRQDVLANNMANLNTVGFKPDQVSLRSRPPERLEDGHAIDPNWMLERLGGGLFSNPTRIDLSQGDLTTTGNDLDLAIQGEGFFVINNGRNGSADNSLRLTRDGRFTMNAGGELVMAASGMRVMDEQDLPIRLDRGAPVRIDGDGSIWQRGDVVAKLQVATVADKAQLKKEGESLLRIEGRRGMSARESAVGNVNQGMVEASGVDPVLAMNDMINASKAVQSNGMMMQYHDNLLGQVISTMGRVA